MAEIIKPAIDGPSSLALLNMEEFRAIAFPKSSLFSIMSTTNDCLVGISKAFTRPKKMLKGNIYITEIFPVKTSRAKAKA